MALTIFMKIEFFKHNIDKDDIKNAERVLDSIFISRGQANEQLEMLLAKYLGNKYCLTVSSCTAALHLSLLGLGIKEGDEVITTPLSYVASTQAIEYVGAKPVFVDVERNTGNIDARNIEKAITGKTKAILPVHLYGQMVDMKKIRKIADKHKLKIIEDAAHCLEGKRDGIRPVQFGDTACFSFYATKNITSGEGGAIGTNDKNLAEKVKKLSMHGVTKGAEERYTKLYQHYDVTMLGWNYKLSGIQAALLLNQLKKIEKRLRVREKIARQYDRAFKNHSKIEIPKVLSRSKHARYLYTIWVNPQKRDYVLHQLQKKGIGVAVNFRPIHLMKYFREKYGYQVGDYPVAEEIGSSTISLPLYPKLKPSEVKYIIEKTLKAINYA